MVRDESSSERGPAPEEQGDACMAEKAPDEALRFYLEASMESEVPAVRLMLKLARAALAAGEPATAASWCARVVDTGGYAEWVAAAGILRQCPSEARGARRPPMRVALVATWTTKTLAPLLTLAAARCGLAVDVWEAEYGQYFNETLQTGSALYAQDADAIILLPDERALGIESRIEPDPAALEAEIGRWTGIWDSIHAQSSATLVQMGVALRGGDIFGNLAAGFPGSLTAQGTHLNAALAEQAGARDIAFVDADGLAARQGKESWFDDRSWYMAKIPYAPAALCRLAHEMALVLAARAGLSRRCLVLDLDNTLWGGVIGDDGLAGIRLGEGVEGEAFADFQRALKVLTTRGILLAVCSKNDIEVAKQPFEQHPEMVLGLDDIAAFVANWEPKSEGLLRISRDLDLGLESLTFFDDNAYEREEVRRRLPDVDVPVLPAEPTRYRAALEAYPYFEPGSFTAADAKRGDQYRARAQAMALRDTAGSIEDYQKSLDMVARIGPIDDLNMARVVQLINKTNQFNLTARRRNRAELEAFIAEPEAVHFWVRLTDRFADHGLIAVVLGAVADGVLEIDTLLMSCRVIGRGVEEVMLRHVADLATERGAATVRGVHIPTERNGMVADLYPRLGFAPDPDGEGSNGTRSFWAKCEDLQHKAHIRVDRLA